MKEKKEKTQTALKPSRRRRKGSKTPEAKISIYLKELEDGFRKAMDNDNRSK
jgi:hypothetical protein